MLVFKKTSSLVKNFKQGTRKMHIIVTHTDQVFCTCPIYYSHLSLSLLRAHAHTYTHSTLFSDHLLVTWRPRVSLPLNLFMCIS